MKPTLRIAARPALSAGLATSAWRTQGGSMPSSLMQAAAGCSGSGGKRVYGSNGQPSALTGTGFSNMPRHEIDTPIYREVAM